MITIDNQSLRKKLRAQRNTLNPALQATHSKHVIEQFLNHPLFSNHSHIGCYLADEGEINTHELIKHLWQANKNCYLPITDFKQKILHYVHYTPHSTLMRNRYHILEPEAHSESPTPLSALECVIVPVVAFDSKGYRLGRGAGCYDITFQDPKNRPILIGFAHDFQYIEQITVNHWDVPLNFCITEKQIYTFQLKK